MEPWELDRLRAILTKEAVGFATGAEQEELRAIINNHTGKALGLPWHALVEVAQFTVRLYAEGDESPGQAVA